MTQEVISKITDTLQDYESRKLYGDIDIKIVLQAGQAVRLETSHKIVNIIEQPSSFKIR